MGNKPCGESTTYKQLHEKTFTFINYRPGTCATGAGADAVGRPSAAERILGAGADAVGRPSAAERILGARAGTTGHRMAAG